MKSVDLLKPFDHNSDAMPKVEAFDLATIQFTSTGLERLVGSLGYFLA